MKVCSVLGVNINVLTMKETIDIIEKNLDSLKGKYICVSNVHTTIMANDSSEYKQIQNEAFMRLPDGRPLSLISKAKGFKESERVTGPDLMGKIFEVSELRGYTHFFYGSTEDTLKLLQLRLLDKYPSLKVSGMYSPPFRKLSICEDEDIVKKINSICPDFLWVGLGAPKQELWMYEHKNRVRSLMIGVGAGFDYFAGNIKRAPKWMQDLSMEWLYRLVQQPNKLFKRYLTTNFKFIYLVIFKRR
jgi:N-acetylglucosaminyldiphosphoundecaprenol N-acetyl-beta-D-mannosaminyltransferase